MMRKNHNYIEKYVPRQNGLNRHRWFEQLILELILACIILYVIIYIYFLYIFFLFFVRYFNFYFLISDAVEVYLGDMETGPVTSTPRKRKEKEDIPSSTPKKRPKLYRLVGRHGPGRYGKAQNHNIVIQLCGRIRKKCIYICWMMPSGLFFLGPRLGL